MANLLENEGLALVSRMELIARHAVEGFLSGMHPSPFHGSSVEYADHRPYTMGDEIRTIDWKLLAKTDKYYVKLYEDQTNLRATILLDASKSMAYRSEAATLSKYDYGCRLAAALAYLMLRQKDAVGLALFHQRLRHYLPARSTASHFRLMIQQMQATTPDGQTGSGAAMHDVASRIKRRGMIILISDLLDDLDQTLNGLGRFRFDKHDVIVMHVMDPAELHFPFEGMSRFRDSETMAQVVTNPRHVKKLYLDRLAEFLQTCKRRCLERGISYELADTQTPYEKLLSAYLERRKVTTV